MMITTKKQLELKNTFKFESFICYVKLFFLGLVTCLVVMGCEKKVDVAQAVGGMPAMPVSFMVMNSISVPISAEAVAQIEGSKEVEIRPRVGGILQKKLFEEGSTVKAGQTMFLIDPVPYQIALSNAKAKLAQQEARVEQTKREAARLDGLLASQSISKREFDSAVSDNALALAGLAESAAVVQEAELNLSYTKVTSPLSGIAGHFEFSEGALVNANTSLLTKVSQINPIWVRFSLSDYELAKLGGHMSQKNVKKITLIMADGHAYSKNGQLNFVASGIDPQLGTQQLRAVFENIDKQLLPGQFVRVRITTGYQNGAFVVPQTAVMNNDQGKFVYVLKDNKLAVVTPIEVGEWVGQDWVVLAGLKSGDKVIVDNLIKLHPGAIVSAHPAVSISGSLNTDLKSVK